MEDTLTLYPPPSWRLLASTFHLIAVVILAICLARRRPFRILRKPHALRLDPSVALQRPRQHLNNQPQPPPALPPLHKSVPPLKAITSSFRAKLSAFRVVTTLTRFTSWTAIFASFAFALTVAIFATGAGLDRYGQTVTPVTDLQPTSNCQSATYTSVILYVLTKIFVYVFLIERVHIVSYAGRQPPRLSTGIYRFGVVAICIYIVIFSLMIHGRVVELATPSWLLESSPPAFAALPTTLPVVCTIGLKVYAAVPLLVYDVLISIVLTVMFVFPLITVGKAEPHSAGVEHAVVLPEATPPYAQDDFDDPATLESPPLHSSKKPRAPNTRSAAEGTENESFVPRWRRGQQERLRCLARRSCLAAIAALTCSTLNIIILIQRRGRETGWIFLLWGTLDVTVNAVAVFFMTAGEVDQDDERIPPILDVGPSSYPLADLPSSVPAVWAPGFARLSWVHSPSTTNELPQSLATDRPDVLPSRSPREPRGKLLRQPIQSHPRGPVTTIVPSPKITLQARGISASEERIHLKVYQSHKSAESSSSEGGVIHTKVNIQECVAEEHSGAGDLQRPPSRPPNAGKRGEKDSRIRLSVDASSGPAFPQWWIREPQEGSSLPH